MTLYWTCEITMQFRLGNATRTNALRLPPVFTLDQSWLLEIDSDSDSLSLNRSRIHKLIAVSTLVQITRILCHPLLYRTRPTPHSESSCLPKRLF
jgi:hypothetical protein